MSWGGVGQCSTQAKKQTAAKLLQMNTATLISCATMRAQPLGTFSSVPGDGLLATLAGVERMPWPVRHGRPMTSTLAGGQLASKRLFIG